MYKFWLRFNWSLLARVQLTIFQHWFRWGLGTGKATSHYLNQWWLVYWRIYTSLGLNELNVWTSIYLCEYHALCNTVETLYSTIYYSKYFIELNFDKSTQYVALWTHKRHPIPRPFGRVSFMSTSTEIDRVIKGFYCIVCYTGRGLTQCCLVMPYSTIARVYIA